MVRCVLNTGIEGEMKTLLHYVSDKLLDEKKNVDRPTVVFVQVSS